MSYLLNPYIYSSPDIDLSGLYLNFNPADEISYSGSGTSVYDHWGSSGAVGTLSNGTSFTSGTADGVFTFDGVDDIIDSGDSGPNDLFCDSNGSFTVAIWARFNTSQSADSYYPIVGRAGGTGVSGTFLLYMNAFDSTIRTNLRGVVTTTSVSNLKDGAWHHYAITWDTTTAKLYIDGSFVQNLGVGTASVQSYSMTLGSNQPSGTVNFTGDMGQFVVYSRALNSTEIQKLFDDKFNRYRYLSSTSPTLWLEAGDSNSYPGSGNTWYDLANSYDGTLTNGPYLTTLGGHDAIQFDGVDDYVTGSIPSTSTTNVSIQMWVYMPSSDGGAFIHMGGGSNGYSMGIGSGTMDTSGSNLIFLFPGIRWAATTSSLGTGWKMVTMVLNGSSVISGYIGNTQVSVPTGSSPIAPTSSYNLGRNIGDEPSGPRAFNGGIGMVKFFPSAITLSDISLNYYAEKHLYGL